MNAINTVIHTAWKARETDLHKETDKSRLAEGDGLNTRFYRLSGQAGIYGIIIQALENELAEASILFLQTYVEEYLKQCRKVRDGSPFNSLNNIQAAGECFGLRKMNDELLCYLARGDEGCFAYESKA